MDIQKIDRPHPNLLKQYAVTALCAGPFLLIVLPILYFRYHTMRYRFDAEGVTKSWGIFFRHEVRLNYTRIQDIHVVSGLIQRWLGLADLLIQTASGSSAAEMTIEGILEYKAVRDFLYSRMRGVQDHARPQAEARPAIGDGETDALLGDILSELRKARQALEQVASRKDAR